METNKNNGNTDNTGNQDKQQLDAKERELLRKDREKYPKEWDVFPCQPFGFFDVREILHAFGIIGVFEGDEFIPKLTSHPRRLKESFVFKPPYAPGVSICLLQEEVEDEQEEGQQYHVLFQHVGEEFILNTLARLFGAVYGSFSVIVGEEQPRPLRALLHEWLSHDEESLISSQLFAHWAKVREETDKLFPKKPKPEAPPQAE